MSTLYINVEEDYSFVQNCNCLVYLIVRCIDIAYSAYALYLIQNYKRNAVIVMSGNNMQITFNIDKLPMIGNICKNKRL